MMGALASARAAIAIAAVWGLLYGVAWVLGVAPRPASRADVRAEPGHVAEEAAPSSALPTPEQTPASLEGLAPPLAEKSESETEVLQEAAEGADEALPETLHDPFTPLCEGTPERPRVFPVSTPRGEDAILLDCGGVAELLVPTNGAPEALVVARFTLPSPLARVDSKDLDGDGRADLAFAFASRLVLLHAHASGVYGAPRALEGVSSLAVEEDATPLLIGGVSYGISARGDAFSLIRTEAPPRSLLVRSAPLLFHADL